MAEFSRPAGSPSLRSYWASGHRLYARYGWEIDGESVPDSNQNTAGARDRVGGLLSIDAYVGPIIPDAAQLDTEAEIAA